MNTLFCNAVIVTMDDRRQILPEGFAAVRDGRIESVGSVRPEGSFDREIDCGGKLLLPGLVNAHTHVTMSLLRGYADGHDLHSWLNDWIFPAEDLLDADAVRAGTLLSMAELIAGGVTCIADGYYHCDEIIEAVLDAGISANIARSVSCFDPTIGDPMKHRPVQEQKELLARWHGAGGGRIRIDAGIHGEYTSYAMPELWRHEADWAREEDLVLQLHLSETRSEQEDCIRRWGKTPTEVMDEAGVWDARALAAHAVQATDSDLDILAEKGVTVVHNPVSNLKLGSGIAPIPAMLARGIRVALGTDGPSSNDSQDLFEEMKLAVILHRGAAEDPGILSTMTALDMATRSGADALGRNAGRIEAGRVADLILVDSDRPGLTPCFDPISALVYCAGGHDVCLTMAQGRILYENGEWTTLDVPALLHDARAAARRIRRA